MVCEIDGSLLILLNPKKPHKTLFIILHKIAEGKTSQSFRENYCVDFMHAFMILSVFHTCNFSSPKRVGAMESNSLYKVTTT